MIRNYVIPYYTGMQNLNPSDNKHRKVSYSSRMSENGKNFITLPICGHGPGASRQVKANLRTVISREALIGG